MRAPSARKKGEPNTLDAILGTDAIEILRILAKRDKELSKEIDAIAKDLLADVSIEVVADNAPRPKKHCQATIGK